MIDAILILLSCIGTCIAGYMYAMSKTRREIREIRKQAEDVIQRVTIAQETILRLQEQEKTQTDALSLQDDASNQSK